MLYVITGTDFKKIRAKQHALIGAMQKRRADAERVLSELIPAGGDVAVFARLKLFYLHLAAGALPQAQEVLAALAETADETDLLIAQAALVQASDLVAATPPAALVEPDREVEEVTIEELKVAAYPSPIHDSSTFLSIRYELPAALPVHLEVFDALGRRVALLVDEVQGAGMHEAVFEAADLPSGVYVYRIRAGGFESVRRMLLVK